MRVFPPADLRQEGTAPPPRHGGGGERSEPEGADMRFVEVHAPSTMLRMVPLPRFAGAEPVCGRRGVSCVDKDE
jgi:hypothetical protein